MKSYRKELLLNDKKGISLITVIITIITIIVLAAIVMFTGLRTPDKASFSEYVHSISDVNTAIMNEYTSKNSEYISKDQIKSDSEIYYAIATGNEVNINDDLSELSTGTLDELNIETVPVALLGSEFYEVTDTTNTVGDLTNRGYYESLGNERHYITDEGEFFVLPGYKVKDGDTTKWYINESKYYVSDEPVRFVVNPSTRKYTVTFNSNGGSSVESIKNIERGATISKPADPTKERSIFVGWYKDSGFVNEFQFGVDTITRSIVLYAKWEAEPNVDVDVTYTVEYYKQNTARDGYDLADTESLAGTPNTTVTASVKTYRGFSYDSSVFGTKTSGKIASDGSLVLKLFYTRNTYTISYELDGGINAGGNPTSYVYGVGASLADARREGYTFTGWYSSSTISLENKVTSISTTDNKNITLYAGWVINTSSLTIKPNGGNVVITSGGTTETITADKKYKQNQNTTLTYETPTKEDTTSYSSNYVSYNTDGGSIAPTTQYTNRIIVTGYTFSGWTKGSGFKGTLDETAKTYTFPADNGVTSTITAYYTPYTISETVAPVTLAAAPTKTGYTFAGWKSSVNNQVYNAGASYTPLGNTTMTAQWTINASSLTVNPNGGSVKITSPTGGAQETITTSKTYTQNYNTTLTYVNPTKEDTISYSSNYVSYNTDGGSIAPTTQYTNKIIVTGYTFSGWTKGSGFKGTLDETAKKYTFPADNGVTSTITAYYTPYTISETVAPVTLAAAPTKTGYTFAGWKSSVNNQVYNAGASYTPLGNTTMTAQWKVNNYSVDGIYYSTLSDAYNAAINSENNTIKVERDNIDSSTFTVESGKTITLDTNGKTITKTTSSITNNGTLTIKGTGTIKTTEDMSLIITNKSGGLTIGENDGVVSTEGPVIQGGTYGIKCNGVMYAGSTISSFNFYDGVIKGKNEACSTSPGKTETNYSTKTTIENIDGVDYEVVRLEKLITITYDDNYYLHNLMDQRGIDINEWTHTNSTAVVQDNPDARYGKQIKFTMNDNGSYGGVNISFTVPDASKTYTWSAYVKTNNSDSFYYDYDVDSRTYSNSSSRKPDYSNWKRISGRFSGGTVRVNFNLKSYSDGDEIYVHSFEIVEGNTPSPEKATKYYFYNDAFKSLPIRTRKGYVFEGWWTAPEGGERITESTLVPESNTTYYAHWTAKKYTINFHPNVLPEEYQEVEYIESTGTQYIDTGFADTSGIKSEYGVAYGETTLGGYIVGSHNTSEPWGRNSGYYEGGTSWVLAQGNNQPRATYSGAILNTKLDVEFSTLSGNAYLNINGNRLITSNGNESQGQVISSNNVWIFYNQYGQMEGMPGAKAKLYYAKIYNHNNELVRDYVPCYRKSDGVIGLYDRANNNFYTNAGTGTFLKGNNVQSSLPHTQNFIYDDSITLDANTFAYDGYTFANWNTLPNGTGSSYEDEANVSNVISATNSTEIDLYAQWTSNYSVDGKYYPTLASAYNSITGDSGIIKLEKDCIDASNFTIEDDKTVLLDLNGKSLTKATNSITNNGILLIQGDGTIKTTESMSLIKNNSTGILTIGKKDGNMNAEAPVIQGGTYAIESTGIISFNDGILKGTTTAVKDNIDEKINYIEDGYVIVINTEDINGTTYQTAYLGGSVSLIFNPNYEATEVITKNYACNTSFGRLPTITRTGYTFNGWWTDVDGGSQITESTLVPTEGTTYYAHWTVNTYTITYDYNYLPNSLFSADKLEASSWNTATTGTSSRITVTNSFAKYGKEMQFKMNSGNDGGIYIYSNTSLTVGRTYTWSIYLKTNTNKKLIVGQENGGTAILDVTPTWQRFTHTFTANENSYHAFVIYVSDYQVGSVWNAGDTLYVHSLELSETPGLNITATTKTYGNTLETLPTPTRGGYVFNGWWTAPNGGTQISESTLVSATNTTYYAHWTLNYLINDTEEHTGSCTGGVNNILQYTIPAPFSPGDTFILEVDVKGSGYLANYFYGDSNYLQVSKTENITKGQYSTKVTDGYNQIPLTTNYTHHVIKFVLGSEGNGNETKYILFRLFPNNSATIKNVKLYKVESTSNYNIDETSTLINDTGEYSGTGLSDFKQYTLQAPFYEGEIYQLEFDAKGTGVLYTYFHGGNNYLQVSTVSNNDGYVASNGDGSNTVNLTGNYKQYRVYFTLGNTGDGNVYKHILFRVMSGSSASVKNIKLTKHTRNY